MFLEKFSRFFRRYDLHFYPRHKMGAHLPMVEKAGHYSIIDAVRIAKKAGKTSAPQPNGDTVGLIELEVRIKEGVLVLLFHRSSPDAADPMYRKLVEDKMSLRQAEKAREEEQAVSAHLVIELNPYKAGAFRAALEEIPGITIGIIQSILAPILNDYKYGFEDKKGDDQETYSVLRIEGIKSESLSDAIKTQTLSYLTLTRTNVPDAPDGDGIVEPMNDRMRYRIVGSPSDPEWTVKLQAFVKRVRNQGWEDISLDIGLDDNRHRTVKLERDQEAKEMLFVRSELMGFKKELKPCTASMIDEVVSNAIAVIKKTQ